MKPLTTKRRLCRDLEALKRSRATAEVRALQWQGAADHLGRLLDQEREALAAAEEECDRLRADVLDLEAVIAEMERDR